LGGGTVLDLTRNVFETLRSDQEFVLYRGRNIDDASQILLLSPATVNPSPVILRRLEHEYSLRQTLDPAWSARPIAMASLWDRPVLVLGDPGGVPLDQSVGHPLGLHFALRLGINLSSAIDELHRRGVIHKDIKPANVLVNSLIGQCWLTGFGISSRLPRERQSAEPPEFVAGTLAYMAPEQTGRMNRSIDSRSDLYSLGITLYQMLTGTLPFTASDPMEWVHCHIARQAVSVSERTTNTPRSVSAIIMKLLAKNAEERYQTASGVKSDLERCLVEWEQRNSIEEFALGKHDTPDRLLVPEKLYGRAREIETLLAVFERVLASGRPELVLVSGYSGIGKSSVVNELHKVLVPSRGLFALGKFDQYKSDVPYATLAQAFQSLVRPLLGKLDAELRTWRDALREALGPNGSLIADLVPELKLIIGEQPPVPNLPPQDAQRRFQLVFRRFIGVFARPEHPLVLFLDDLQWLDAATLDLLEDLLSQPDVQHLMLIGAYRDNEVDSVHPLMRKLEAIRQAGAIVHELVLAPLSCDDLGRLIADSLHCELERVTSLAQLVHEKTAGNPFFAIQFFSALAEESLLHFDHASRTWIWDVSRIGSKGFTDNVVDLMLGKLSRLPVETQKTLEALACLGNSAEISTLAVVQGVSEEKVHADLWEALRLEFIVRSEGSYKFVHDRVQEAAYSLIPEEVRAERHLQIGRLLTAHTPVERREEYIFEIVNQLNRGAALISSQDEREQLAELNLMAGKRASASTAYATALKYFVAGAAVLPGDCWVRRHELAFGLELYRAECEFLTGELAAADERLTMLSPRAANTIERANIECLRIDLYTALDQTDRAVSACLDYLWHLGVEWSPHPTDEEVRREYERIRERVGTRPIEELIGLPLMSDLESLATLDVLVKAFPSALVTNENLFSMAVLRAVNVSLERGHGDGSCVAYVYFGKIAGPQFGDYEAGFRLGQLGYELVEKRGLKRFQARTYLWFAQFVVPWMRHVQASRSLIRRAFETATMTGDLTVAMYTFDNLNTNFLTAGDSLVETQRQAEHGLAVAEKARFGHMIDIIKTQLGLIRTLRGLTYQFGFFDDGEISETSLEEHFVTNPAAALTECWHWVRKLQARFFAGDYSSALDAASRAQRLLWTSAAMFETAEYHLYGALTRAALCGPAMPDNREEHLRALGEHQKLLALWAKNCPENFANRAALVDAEIARIEGRALDAMDLYEQAIRSARANGFLHNEALANELAARFYAARGFDQIADGYLRRARSGYLAWGADGKVRQLDEVYPQFRVEEPLSGPVGTIGAPVENLDLATVLKVSQAVSGEIVLEKLIDTLMRTAIEHAGAGRGLLILRRDVERWIEAEATTSGDKITVRLRGAVASDAAVPESIIHYVMRTLESVILDDASAQNSFSFDPYIHQHHARSILCIPLINQAKLIGLLYLENNLTPHVFTPARLTVLKLLASQAAISLENTRLYRDLEKREAKIRRLVDANIMGICIWNFAGQIIEANEAFLHIVNYSREDLLSGRLSWKDLTPPEWRDLTERGEAQLKATGILPPYEKEYFRNDGSRVPVLVGSAVFEEGQNEVVSFALDLSEQKRSEDALRRSQARLAEAQTELAHVSRVTALGELTASVAHEISQPLAAVVTNADASLRWLSRDSPDLTEAREAIRRISRDGKRAGNVITRMRSLFKKAGTAKDRLDLNEAIEEVVILTEAEARRDRIALRKELAADLPPVMGDRVQLQQVFVNLILNAIEAMATVEGRERDLVIKTQLGEGDEIQVAVCDSGIGFDPLSAERIFDAFHTTKPGGLGLGLSISRSIVESHGGRLWAAANDGPGVTFQFTLLRCQ
jgi:PAS domain S-box-containing protein